MPAYSWNFDPDLIWEGLIVTNRGMLVDSTPKKVDSDMVVRFTRYLAELGRFSCKTTHLAPLTIEMEGVPRGMVYHRLLQKQVVKWFTYNGLPSTIGIARTLSGCKSFSV